MLITMVTAMLRPVYTAMLWPVDTAMLWPMHTVIVRPMNTAMLRPMHTAMLWPVHTAMLWPVQTALAWAMMGTRTAVRPCWRRRCCRRCITWWADCGLFTKIVSTAADERCCTEYAHYKSAHYNSNRSCYSQWQESCQEILLWKKTK